MKMSQISEETFAEVQSIPGAEPYILSYLQNN